MKRIIVLHEYGAPSHYNALKCLAKNNNYRISFLVFDIKRDFRACAKHPDKWLGFVRNLFSVLFLPYMPKSKVVLGIAPFNSALPRLMKYLNKHEVYYHTSFTSWDGSRIVHETNSNTLKSQWLYYTNNYVKHIFAVSNQTKNELIKNGYSSESKISVVNHSYTKKIITPDYKCLEKTFIQVSSMDYRKGIEELLDFFSINSDYSLTLVGTGELSELVQEYSKKYPNIHYAGYIKRFEELEALYKENCFLLMNSHRYHGWEELFGISIVEGMACGCVPITTDHSGPKEIISTNVNGIICNEGEIHDAIEAVSHIEQSDYNQYRLNAIKTGMCYYVENMASRWRAILD